MKSHNKCVNLEKLDEYIFKWWLEVRKWLEVKVGPLTLKTWGNTVSVHSISLEHTVLREPLWRGSALFNSTPPNLQTLTHLHSQPHLLSFSSSSQHSPLSHRQYVSTKYPHCNLYLPNKPSFHTHNPSPFINYLRPRKDPISQCPAQCHHLNPIQYQQGAHRTHGTRQGSRCKHWLCRRGKRRGILWRGGR